LGDNDFVDLFPGRYVLGVGRVKKSDIDFGCWHIGVCGACGTSKLADSASSGTIRKRGEIWAVGAKGDDS